MLIHVMVPLEAAIFATFDCFSEREITRLCDKGSPCSNKRREIAHTKNKDRSLSSLSSRDRNSLIQLIKSCGKHKDLYTSRRLFIRAKDFVSTDWAIGNALLSMLTKCGAFEEAKQVFEILPDRDVVTWSALISGYAQHGYGQDALKCFNEMLNDGILPDAITFTCVLKACGSTGLHEIGEHVHMELKKNGLLEKDITLGNSLVDMYAKCGMLDKAHHVFTTLPNRNRHSWNVLISGYAQQGHGKEALECFKLMENEGISPDAVTFTCALKACGSIRSLHLGEEIHTKVKEEGLLEKDFVLGTSLVDMYAKCGALQKAQHVFEELPKRTVVSWTVLVAGYAQHGCSDLAIDYFRQMQDEGITPNLVTFTCILKACGSLGSLKLGKKIHQEVKKKGLLEKEILLGTALVDMYAKCGELEKAREVLEEIPKRDVGSWSALIAGYAQHGHGDQALRCFKKMKCEGVSPNAITLTCMLKVCGSLGTLELGTEIHAEANKQGLLQRNIFLGTALVDMYAKCGLLQKAHEIFRELPKRDVISWTSLIRGYTEHGYDHLALKCFQEMQNEGIDPDVVTYICVLKACCSICCLQVGEEIHEEVKELGLLGKDIVLGNTLVDMYSKCGALYKAQEVFRELPNRDIFSWNAMLGGHAQMGEVKRFFHSLRQMRLEGTMPDSVSFLLLLNACSHTGLLEEGEVLFDDMCKLYYVTPQMRHYTCMVNLFGRAGHFNKVVSILNVMPSCDHLPLFSSLLFSCYKWVNLELGRWAFEKLMQLNVDCGATYVNMSNIGIQD